MARHNSPPDSPLSSMGSANGYDDEASDADDLPPAKRQKVGSGSTTASPALAPEPEPAAVDDVLDGMSDVSSDTSGEVPSSPVNARPDDDEFQEQVTVCAWEGCKGGDMGNMDKLVEHIHNDHIETRAKKYTREWIGCSRKSMPHASGYALKAHMRSHTREKPFYCYLPECDRAFTRSDALAKHMRTVHETEALRPSDPVPKSMQGASGTTGKSGRLKIILKTPQSHAAGQDGSIDVGQHGEDGSDFFTPLERDQGFSEKELAMPLERLYTLCCCQVKWAESEGEALRKESKKWEDEYKAAWLEKEVLLEQVMQNEKDWHRRRQEVLSGAADVHVSDVLVNGTVHNNGSPGVAITANGDATD